MNKPYDDKTDSELLQAFHRDGDNEWLGILLQRYTGMLLGVSMKYLKNTEEAADSVQQIFLKVLGELKKYKVEYFKSWLYMIAKNHCLMLLRDKKRTGPVSDDHAAADDQERQSEAKAKEQSLTDMEQALALLNNEQRLCITLFFLRKKTYQEITALTGYSLMQVKSNIQNGKRNLRIHMQKMQKDE